MGKNALTIFDQPQLAVPDYVNDAFGDEKNIVDRVTVPSLSYGGKVWTIHNNGEKTKITKKDDDGDEIPVSVMRVVVLDYAKRRGRAYYEGAYDPDKPGAPLCWSDDGVKPHDSVKEPQHSKCEGCPMAVKGSKVTESGKAITACSQHRMLVVVPAGKLDYTPLRLKLAITSDWDKQNPDMERQGWFAFNNYTDFLRTKNLPHTAAIVTKMKFDPNVDYPKVMFSPDRWLSKEEASVVKPILKSDAVQGLLNGTWTPAGVDGKKIMATASDDDEDEAPPPAKKAAPKAAAVEEDDEDEAPPPPKKAAAKKAAPVVDEDDDDVEIIPPPKAKVNVAVDDDDEDEAPPPPKKAKAEPKAETKKAKPKADEAKVAAEVPADVADLLDEWGDD